jgi:hypothetical protein
MDGLDLNINNYTMVDLEKFFHIKPNKKYSASDIELKETEIRELLLSTGHIDKRFKRDLLIFLETAKKWLIVAKCEPEQQQQLTPRLTERRSEDAPMARQETPYINTFNSEYFPGIMNPLKTRIISKYLNIDTRFRDRMSITNSSDFLLNLPIKFQKVVSMQITSIEFPVSFYGISSKYGNNYFYIAARQMLDEINFKEDSRIVIIPDGNYNAIDFITTLNSLLQLKNEDNSFIDPGNLLNYVQFRLDMTPTGSGTAKVILETFGLFATMISSIILDFAKDINGINDKIDITTKIGMNIGFLKRKYQGQKRYVSESLLEPANIRYIYLAIDDFNNSVNNNFVCAFNQSILSPNILGRISIKASYFSLLMETDLNLTTEPRKYFGPVDIQKLHIKVYDDHGRILDTNNGNFSICILFKMLYDL